MVMKTLLDMWIDEARPARALRLGGRPVRQEKDRHGWPREDEVEDEFSVSALPASVQDAYRRTLPWEEVIRRAIDAGVRNENLLADIVFFMHHPKLMQGDAGRVLQPNDPNDVGLIAEWKKWRAEVRRLLDAVPGTNAGSLPEVSVRLQASGPGYRAKNLQESYGIRETIQALQHVAEEWHRRHPGGPLIIMGDISRLGGGKLPPHNGHDIGLDADLSLEGTAYAGSGSSYVSKWRPLYEDLARLIMSNPYLRVKQIFFNDKQIKEKLKKNWNALNWSDEWDPKHYKHMHVQFCIPARYERSVERVSGESRVRRRACR
jgi:Penicillin-insensitive murein endopeptidase